MNKKETAVHNYITRNGVNVSEVEQQGSKSLYVAKGAYYKLLISYYTVIAIQLNGESWQATCRYYSVTTSRQLNQHTGKQHETMSESEFAQLLCEVTECNAWQAERLCS